MTDVETVLLVVAVATVVAASANRLAVPAPSLLVLAGVAAGLLPGVPHVRIPPDAISLVVLPPLIYASGEELSLRDLRAVWRPVAVLSVGLVLVSAVAAALVAGALTPLAFAPAFVLGAILASTDPVAVSALARRLSLPPRTQTLVQAESLFNDATSLLLFKIALSAALAGGAMSAGAIGVEFAKLAGGGAAIGWGVAAAARVIRRRVEDPLVDTVISLVTPYAAYVVAEAVGAAGVTAVVVAAVILSGQVTKVTNAHTRIQRHAVYETLVFLLESTIFGLIGLQLPTLVRDLPAGERFWFLPALAVTATLMAVRFLGVFQLSAAARWRSGAVARLKARRRESASTVEPGDEGVSGRADGAVSSAGSGTDIGSSSGSSTGSGSGSGSAPADSERRLSWRVPIVVSWAGARGVVPLAAALSIPLTTDSGAAVPNRALLLVLVTGVVVITLLVQGFTLAPLVAWAGVAVPSSEIHQEGETARLRLAQAAITRLEELADSESAPSTVVERLRTEYAARLAYTVGGGDDPNGETPALAAAYRRMRRDLIEVEQGELDRLHADGEITDRTRRSLQRMLDLEDLTLGGG